MTSDLDNVNELLKLKIGDIGRLNFIKDFLEKNKPLYSSDKEYLENLTKQHLIGKIQDDQDPDIADDETSKSYSDISANDNNSKQPKSFCKHCGSELSDENFCPKCGPSHTATSPISQKRSNAWYLVPIIFSLLGGIIAFLILRKSDSSKAKKCLIIGIVIFILWSVIMIAAASSNVESDNSATIKKPEVVIKKPELTLNQIKDSAERGVTYDSLMRFNEKYVGKVLYLEGEVIQSVHSYGDNYLLRVSITKEDLGYGTTYYTDPILVNYDGARILEEDIVGVYGKVKGVKDYTAVLGNTVSVPEVDSLSLNVLHLEPAK